eukprot:gene7305-9952_t
MTDRTPEDTNVRVAVRCRPFNEKERNNGETSCVKILPDKVILINPNNSSEEHSFAFDLIIDESFTQETIWNNIGTPILDKAFSGYNGTIFAYGQTGSGKTWSMQGGSGENRGIIPRMNQHLFHKIDEEKEKRSSAHFLVTVSYFEIYNEVIFDLLDGTDRKKKSSATAKGGLEIKEHPVLGVYVKGLQEIVVDNASKLQSIIDQGMGNRTVASTQMNADSSRSHSVFVITVHQKDLEDESKNVYAKVNLVDLAGSERVKSTGATGSTLKEGANINKSLSALGNVINALVEAAKGKGTFIPYRNSKLTRVLQESLGGNSITAMLAALSPAACNFDETLSTLKYANRAKDIKIKAVKNEEASQISKLNEEIRILKEKLIAQNATVDTSVLEDKHRQQLKELEQAMRNTWEEKSKASQEYEKERQVLLMEQQNAAKQLENAKERNWKLIEQKGDLEITLGHVKDLTRKSNMNTSLIIGWQSTLKNIVRLEQQLAEQDTVVQVYRTALEKDNEALIKQNQYTLMKGPSVGNLNSTANASVYDTITLSMLRQLKEKLAAIKVETIKWGNIQDELIAKMNEFLHQINSSSGFTNNDPTTTQQTQNSVIFDFIIFSESEKNELIRGLKLINRQLAKKNIVVNNNIIKIRSNLIEFAPTMGNDMISLMKNYEADLVALKNLGTSGDINEKEMDEIITNLNNMQKLVQSIHQLIKDIHIKKSPTNKVNNNNDNLVVSQNNNNNNNNNVHKEETQLYDIIIHDMNLSQITTSSTLMSSSASISSKLKIRTSIPDSNGFSFVTSNTSSIHTDGNQCWIYTNHNIHDLSNHNPSSEQSDNKTTPLIIQLSSSPTELPSVSSISIQGGYYMVPNDKSSDENLLSSSATNDNNALFSTLSLPCGLKLQTCDGNNTDLTCASLGDVIDWQVLLKRNPPEKFLKRPPVRFLFDLIKFIGSYNPSFFPISLDNATWEIVGSEKQSKLDFMQEVINFISSYLKVTPITTAASIVTGSDADLTNILLQQLAVSLYHFKYYNQNNSNNKNNELSTHKSTSKRMKSWVTSVRVQLSTSGIDNSWNVHDEIYQTNLSNDEDKFTISLNGGPFTAKYMKLTPISWNQQDIFYPSLRLNIFAMVAQDSNDYIENISDNNGVISLITSARVVEIIDFFFSSIEKMVESVGYLRKRDDANKLKKQDEVKRSFEQLAKEKLALEQLLAQEKQSIENDKQDLADQVKKLYNQLRETKSLFEREQELNNQLENERKQLENEKNALLLNNKEKEEEITHLKTTVLKLQANYEKNNNFVESIQTKCAEQDKQINELKLYLDEYDIKKSQFEHEKEELLSQLSILTEERDASRANEEQLFETLTERTNDLERLQESYVDIADRCNDAQDEVSELRDQLQAYQEAITNRAAMIGNTSSNNPFSFPSPIINQSKDIADTIPSENIIDKKIIEMNHPSITTSPSAADSKHIPFLREKSSSFKNHKGFEKEMAVWCSL